MNKILIQKEEGRRSRQTETETLRQRGIETKRQRGIETKREGRERRR